MSNSLVKKFFELADANKNGYIDKNELQDFVMLMFQKELEISAVQKQLMLLMWVADTNKDGKIGVLELSKWIKMLPESSIKALREQLEAVADFKKGEKKIESKSGLKVIVRTLTGMKIPIVLPKSYTVWNLKQIIENKTDFKKSKQKLFLGKTPLKDGQLMSSLGITEKNDVISLIISADKLGTGTTRNIKVHYQMGRSHPIDVSDLPISITFGEFSAFVAKNIGWDRCNIILGVPTDCGCTPSLRSLGIQMLVFANPETRINNAKFSKVENFDLLRIIRKGGYFRAVACSEIMDQLLARKTRKGFAVKL